jgi:branched-subunit amino acid transport protein
MLWITILILGLMTFALRLSFILLEGRVTMPQTMRRALEFVPPAVLSAIIAPELVLHGGALDVSPGNARLLAGALAALVAWRTRNVLLTIGVGMAALLALRFLLP